MIMLSFGGANRDPDVFEHPEELISTETTRSCSPLDTVLITALVLT